MIAMLSAQACDSAASDWAGAMAFPAGLLGLAAIVWALRHR